MSSEVRQHFTRIAREIADAASEAASVSSKRSASSHASSASGSKAPSIAGSGTGSVAGSGSIASSHPSAGAASGSQTPASPVIGPSETQALFSDPASAGPQGQQVKFARGSQGSKSGSSVVSGGSSLVSSEGFGSAQARQEGGDVRRVLLQLCIPAAVFAGVYNIGPLVMEDRLTDAKGKLDKKKLLVASSVAAGVAFLLARLVV